MFRRLKPYQLGVDIAVALGFLAIVWPLEALAMGGLGPLFAPSLGSLSAAAICLLFSAALALRRVSPALALAIAWGGALLQVGLGRQPSIADLAIFAVLYTTAAYGSKAVYWCGFASALVGALIIAVYLTAGPIDAGGGLSWENLPFALILLVAAAFALGLAWTIGALVRTAVRARENRLGQKRAEAEAIAEQERVRIARDMHDIVAHSLAVVIAQADGARYAAAANPDAAADALGTISTTARSALADVRLLLTQLRHSQGAGPQPTIADLEALYAQVRAAGVELRVDVDPAPPGVPPAAVQLAVYRILQEALTNALRHGAPGGPVDVALSWHPDRVDLTVRNPLGPASASVDARGQGMPRGHGIIGMRERAQLAGGRLDAGEESGSFAVRATLPVRAA